MAITAENRFHVLAVDDSLIDRKLIERLLRTSSYQVTTVESGSKALEFLGLRGERSNSPSISANNHHQEMEVNLVITDYCMPGMTGYDLLKKIKETSSLKNIPVVIMSSENVPARITRCLEEGAEEFFLKPVQLSDMKRLQSHILKGKLKDQQQQQPLSQPHLQPQQSQPLPQQHLHPQQSQPPSQTQRPQQLEPQQQKQQPEPQEQQLEPQQQQSQPQPESNNSKRKAMDEGLSTECRRSRYNGLTTAA